MGEYRLSCELRGHEEDVRAVCVISDDCIATASRDKTVRLWRREAEGGSLGGGSSVPAPADASSASSSMASSSNILPYEFVLDKTMVGHSSFVGALAWLPPGADVGLPDGALVSGGMDCRMLTWDLTSAQTVRDVKGHEQQVTSLAAFPPFSHATFVSASIDKSIGVWKGAERVALLMGHESSVLSLALSKNGDIFSGSGDCSIKVWRDGECIRTIKGHLDSVRSLAVLEGVGVVSGSHDSTVRVWGERGEQLLELYGHSSLVFGVAARQSQAGSLEIASGSEDRTAKVWQDGACIQTIEHPGCVWAVAYLPNGDLVTTCSDGVARIWTRFSSRFAPDSAVAAFQELLASSSSKAVGGVNIDSLPGQEALQQPGKKDGQTKIVREEGQAVAYSWSDKDFRWDRIGEVVDGPSDPSDPGSSPLLNGKSFDFVFDVDIGDGLPIRKLPYNRGENPYDVADKWLLEQDLPIGYRQQVVDFILQNSAQGPTASSSVAPLPPNFNPDPYTGGGHVTPVRPAASPQLAPPTLTTASSLFPQRTMLVFESAQFDAISSKIAQLNSTLMTDMESTSVALSEAELGRVGAVLATLKESSRYHASRLAESDLHLVIRAISSWPIAHIFPFLDVLRLILLHPSAAESFARPPFNDSLLAVLKRAIATSPLTPNLLTSLRVVVNAFRHIELRDWLTQHHSEILDLLPPMASSTSNKHICLALSTLLLNFSILLGGSSNEDGQIQVLSATLELLSSLSSNKEDAFSDSKVRCMRALGTIIVLSKEVKRIAQDLDMASILDTCLASSSGKTNEAARELKALFSTQF